MITMQVFKPTLNLPRRYHTIDPREIVILGVAGSLAAWHANALGLLVFWLVALIVRFQMGLESRLNWQVLRRIFYFCFFWGGLALILDLISIWSGGTRELALSHMEQGWIAAQAAALIVLRLSVLIFGAALLNSLSSAYSMGLALTWFLKPIFKTNAWRPALALALMINFLHMILYTNREARQGIRSRALDLSSVQYGWMFLLQFFRLALMKARHKATGVVLRNLDSMAGWSQLPSIPLSSWIRILLFCALAWIIVALL